MNEIAEKDVINIENIIYEIDGKKVMLDSDLAKLYNVETKRVNEAVNRNKEKFPSRISWITNDKEVDVLWSQNATANISSKSRTNPRVFTEQGVYMLATILKSKEAIKTSIRIMDTFVKMRHYINYNKNILPRRFLLLEEKVDNNTKRIDELFDKFNPKEITKDSIFFKGDIYDAYSVLLEIFNLAKDEIIIIDNYVGKVLLDELRSIDKNIIIISSNINVNLRKKYLKQYNNIKFIKNDSYHDRFIIIDRKIVFHSGASFKDLGRKCFGIHEIENYVEIEKLINEVIKKCSIDN
ncbi:protein containing KilA-N, DNA-binding domain protein [human gut metagenome]|uniref:Protein containing KilA-N, DNA-binding domain protein n=1 Tax=human gut metagenome TaxID=408170 RepID=K1RVR4_9ZZZZ